MTYPCRHISVAIQRPASEVYAFASKPQNLPLWAAGLAGSLSEQGGEWVADSPMGKIRIKFVEGNVFGVMDHDVTLPNGQVVGNPMRVIPNGQGSELVFTLFRRPEMSDIEFTADYEAVEKDLKKLRDLLENP